MRTIIYGDIHGCLEEFKMLRAELDISKEDQEISVGDFLDRGPYSNETLSYARNEGIKLVLGNHEYKYLRYKKHDDAYKATGKKNPMLFNEGKLEIYNNLSKEDFEYLVASPFFIKIDNLSVIHAGITNKIDLDNLSKKDKEALTRIRELDSNQKTLMLGQKTFGSTFWSEVYNGNQGVIVYGHEVFDKVKINRYSFGIDTGCVYGNKLTALIIYDTKDPTFSYDIVQISALKKYVEKKNFK